MSSNIRSVIEALLFAKGDGINLGEFSEILDIGKKEIKQEIEELKEYYDKEKSGIQINKVGDMYQMSTNPEYADYIEKLVPIKKTSLSSEQLETLAIIAHTQPATKADVEKIRGVDSTSSVNRLLGYNLITEVGRADTPGRPILFATTDDFLRHFNLQDISDI